MIGKNYMHQFNQSHHQILDLSWSTHDLKLYDNQSNSVLASVFTVIAGLTLVLGAIVHRAYSGLSVWPCFGPFCVALVNFDI